MWKSNCFNRFWNLIFYYQQWKYIPVFWDRRFCAAGYRIYVKDGVPLNRSDAEAFAALDVTEKTVKDAKMYFRPISVFFFSASASVVMATRVMVISWGSTGSMLRAKPSCTGPRTCL